MINFLFVTIAIQAQNLEALMQDQYCEAIYETRRRPTREVLVGKIGVGGKNPIRIQSMTTSNTRDVEATIAQIIRLGEAGCEIVRMTVQGIKEAQACEAIKEGLLKRGVDIPLVADIHFYPPAAMMVADFVDKVRINPGNFVDKRASFKTLLYDDDDYARELEKIEEKFLPLLEKCKRLKRSLRIGTNHGSLSDRIMSRYGDTPAGMVESALEFARIAVKNDFHALIFSMKSSNPQVMILAYRLLAAEMYALGWDYPFHLGVTEAGEGEDGRIKSAMGIGSLLLDGIGDTIRVSLTEDPWHEIDPCRRLVHFAQSYEKKKGPFFVEPTRNFKAIERRVVEYDAAIPMHKKGSVFLTLADHQLEEADLFEKLGCEGSFGHPKLKAMSVDNLVISHNSSLLDKMREIGIGLFTLSKSDEKFFRILSLSEALHLRKEQQFAISSFETRKSLLVEVHASAVDRWGELLEIRPSLIFFKASDERVHVARRFFDWLIRHDLKVPVVFHFEYDCSTEDLPILTAMEAGSLLVDGLGEGLWFEGNYPPESLRVLSLSILQAARMRMSKTDFISCPSCGRTLFDLQSVTKRIQGRTAHLPGVKIAIMGCIVNGPGEMADADFGYVGSKPGKIDLYVGKECVQRDIDFSEADERLVDLIKSKGMWKEPSEDQL